MLSKAIEHFVQGPSYHEEVKNMAAIPVPCKENETKMVWLLKVLWSSKDNPTMHNKGKKKKR